MLSCEFNSYVVMHLSCRICILSWQHRAVSVQLSFFTTRKQLGFLAELRVDQSPDIDI